MSLNKINFNLCFLGIELGSTRIKAVLIDNEHNPIATGSFDWENQLENGLWTYSEEMIWQGIQGCYQSLSKEVMEKYGDEITSIGGIGISAMMHGYLAFDKNDDLLVPFRTWRNTNTLEAATTLTKAFNFTIPQRWSVAHLYQAVLNNENHIREVEYLTTLAGYIHWKLTGEKVIGIGDASGMFPIDIATQNYDEAMLGTFENLVAEYNFNWTLKNLLPKIIPAGNIAGRLTTNGAKLLDIKGKLTEGIAFCPPEGDAGTGMVATNAVAKRTGNVSAGTSVFAMFVLEKPLKKHYTEIDIVTTPDGNPVAMVHCNNCTSDINEWASMLAQFAKALGVRFDMNTIFTAIFEQALNGDSDSGRLLNYNYFSGEPITGLENGRPLFVRMPDSKFTFSNLSKSLLYSSLATLKLGMEILEEESVQIDRLSGHGGFFKTKTPSQRVMAAVLKTSVTLMDSAGEGGPWGMAILAAFMQNRNEKSLSKYLNQVVFLNQKSTTIQPNKQDIEDFDEYVKRYKQGLAIEKAAVDML